MPTLTGTLSVITGGDLDPTRVRQVVVRAPDKRASLGTADRLVTTAPARINDVTGEISVDLEPGPALLIVNTMDSNDVYEMYVTADMTLLTEAASEAAPAHERSWVESQLVQLRTETETLAGDAVTAAGTATTAAGQAAQDRAHVDSIRQTLDEAAQSNVAPYLTQSELNATYGTKAEVAAKADQSTATALAESLTEARAITSTGTVAQFDASQARLTPSQDDVRASLTPDGRTAVTLLDGSSTSTIIATNATMSLDPNTKHGATSLKATMAGAVTATIRHTPTTPIAHPPASIVHQWVYIPDPTLITSIGITITSNANFSGGWTRSRPGSEFRRGWNLIRYGTFEGTLTAWAGTVTRLTFTVVTTAATSLLFSRGWVECPPKAQILFVEDRGYVTFKDIAVPWFRQKGFPICWALDPAINSSNPGTRAEAISDADVATFAAAGDEISIHAYAGEVTANMTPDQIVRDSVLAIKWIRDRGYKGSIWRAAWTQNSAVNAHAARPFFAAYATAANLAGYNTWPPVNPWAISRYALHGRSQADIDTRFARLQETRALDVQYTHGIHPNGTTGGADMTPAQWDYWTAKVEAGVADGWLELVTFTQLLERSGGIVR